MAKYSIDRLRMTDEEWAAQAIADFDVSEIRVKDKAFQRF